MSSRTPPQPADDAPLRVLVVCDSQVLVAGLTATLRSEKVAVAGIIRDLDGVSTSHLDGVDVVLIAPTNGIDAAIVPLLRHRVDGAPVIVLLADVVLRIHTEALKCVKASCLPLTASPHEIVEAIRAAVNSDGFGAAVTKEVVRGVGGTLTPREQESLDAVAQGMTNNMVAAELGVTVETVKSHMTSVYRKLGVKNRAAAVAAYLEAR